MNNNNYDTSHPLQRNGTSQKDRGSAALQPSSIRVDERGMAELIAYAHRYAGILNYFQLDNTVDGDWKFFFEVDDTSLLAIISQLPDDYVTSIPQLQADFEYWASQLTKDSIVRNNIEDRLAKDFPPIDLVAANKLFFKIRKDATAHFEVALERDDHLPHIALFLAFLFLYEKAQSHLNTFTARHLDFFLEKVLRLERKTAVPDSVHLIFELAETLKAHRIVEGTEFKAGKDALGKNRFYTLVEELIATKASIAELKTIFIDKEANDLVRLAPIANSLDGQGTEFENNTTGWPTFGSSINGNIGEIGVAVSSPVLYLQEGIRVATLTFNLPSTSQLALPDSLVSAFRVFMTTPEGWLELTELPNAATSTSKTGFTPLVDIGTIRLTLRLQFGDPAFDIFDPEIFTDGFDTIMPTVKILLNAAGDPYAYEALKNLSFSSIDIAVDVKGVSNLIIQNDFAEFVPGKAFMPFGATPKLGANLYLGSSEIFQKNLSEVAIHIEWEGLPKDFADYYSAYPAGITNESFQANIYRLERKTWRRITQRNLFDTTGGVAPYLIGQVWAQNYSEILAEEDSPVEAAAKASKPSKDKQKPIETKELKAKDKAAKEVAPVDDLLDKEIIAEVNPFSSAPYFGEYKLASATNIVLGVDTTLIDTPRTIDLPPSNVRLDNQTLDGFLRLQLNGKDFQHASYPVLYAQAMIQEAKKIFDAVPVDPFTEIDGFTTQSSSYQKIPNLPYTPTIKNIYIDYKSAINIPFGPPNLSEFKNREERLFYVHPYGWEEAHPYLSNRSGINIVPQYRDKNNKTFEGQLLFGIAELETETVLSLLFQVLEGSGDPDAAVPKIDWFYLADNKWNAFNDSMILSDTTLGLIQSGIVQIQIPKKIAAGNTILNGELMWLRAAIRRSGDGPNEPTYNSSVFPKIISIQAQAGLARFDDRGNDLSHLATSLPAGTISKMVVRDTNIKKVIQPYASFGGRLAEEDEAFYRRTSEHLRHKGRAITIWDYERLILEEFSEVFKVKCLSHYYKNSNSPGHVTLGIIPDLSNKNAVDLYRPRVDVSTRVAIEQFLQQKVSPFILCNLHVVNPIYERVRVSLKVVFQKGFDSLKFYEQELNDAIKRHLAPWAYNSDATITFGGQIHKSEILYFIEKLEYVDYVTDFQVDHYVDDTLRTNVNTIITQTPLSILTTYTVPAGSEALDHKITAIPRVGDQGIICEEKNC